MIALDRSRLTFLETNIRALNMPFIMPKPFSVLLDTQRQRQMYLDSGLPDTAVTLLMMRQDIPRFRL